MRLKLKYLICNRDRHGNDRYYVIGYGPPRRKIRIRSTPGTPGFHAEYEAARAELAQPAGKVRKIGEVAPNSMRWLAGRYFASRAFASLDLKSQGVRRSVIESCLQEPLARGTAVVADCPVREFDAQHVKMLRDRRADAPGAANNRRKYLSAMFGWAIENEESVTANPCREIRKLDYDSEGFHPWDEQELERFEQFYPIGTKERLALALLLYTGARGSDVVALGPANIGRDGCLRFVPRKTRRSRKTATPKPYLPALERIVAATKLQGTKTFLVTQYGRPFSVKGFQQWFVEKCKAAGLEGCSAHGLRKLGAARVAEAGGNHRTLMAIFDWSSPAMAEVYIRHAERKRSAESGMQLLAQRQG